MNLTHDPIGTYVTYYVGPEAQINYQDFNRLISTWGLTTVSAARAPKPAHIFRRACTKLAAQGVSISKKDNTKDFTSYVLATNTGPLELIVDKNDGAFTYDLEHELTDQEFGHIEVIMDYLYEWKDMLHEQPIREAIRLSIEGPMQGLSMKPSGGLYFVPPAFTKELVDLEEAYADVGDTEIIRIPTKISLAQRRYLRLALIRVHGSIVEQLEQSMVDLKAALDSNMLEEAVELIDMGKAINHSREIFSTYEDLQISMASKYINRLDSLEDTLNNMIASI